MSLTTDEQRRWVASELRLAVHRDTVATLIIVALCLGIVLGYIIRGIYG